MKLSASHAVNVGYCVTYLQIVYTNTVVVVVHGHCSVVLQDQTLNKGLVISDVTRPQITWPRPDRARPEPRVVTPRTWTSCAT